MKGVLAGMLVAASLGGFFIHIHGRYGTLSPCSAAHRALVTVVGTSLSADLAERVGDSVPVPLADAVLQPLAAPLVERRVERLLADASAWDCAVMVVELDFWDADRLIRSVRSLTVPF